MTGSPAAGAIAVVLSATLVFSGCFGVPDRLPGEDDPVSAPAARHPRVVIAVLEFAGTNPYHADFARPNQTGHPSTFLPGYPVEALPLNLTLDADNYTNAVAADETVWNGTYAPNTLHYVPGTNIVGMVSFGEGLTGLDAGGHGVGTTSLVAGATHGMAPDADLVVVNGDLFAALRWIAEQPWIDAVSISLGAFLGTCTVGVCDPVDVCTGNPFLPVTLVNSTRLLHARGGETFAAASYGCGFRATTVGHPWPGTSITSFFSGPSWVMTVGTYHNDTRQGDFDGAHPVEFLAPATGYKAAQAATLDGEVWFGNASGAVPRAAGAYAALLHHARTLLGDTGTVHERGVVAEAAPGVTMPNTGPLSDGVFTQTEAETLLLHVMTPYDAVASYQAHGGDPADWADDTLPAVPFAEFLAQGYGLLTADTLGVGRSVLSGTASLPARPAEDGWHLATEAARDALWVPVDTLGLYPIGAA